MDDSFAGSIHKADSRPQEALHDFRGLKCPLPALLARRALERAPAGYVIAVLTDDPMAPIDVPHMCRQEGYEALEMRRDGAETLIQLRKPL
ncbi:MAG: sulfurtransferase TusA family protein [Proteobacteria bacterium]|nr:sulfurtransferase TusA family protein [Pseudomonadota bacterium]